MRMPRRLPATLFLAAGLAAASVAAMETNAEIPFERFRLPNGLTVVVSEDHKAPVVAVSVWYHVGSADEPAGKTGFAHLFEHLMFSGSEHHRGSYMAPFERVGATDLNGTTWFDRTNYFQTVPTTALDMALWMESDRMGHLLGAIGQHELDTQRGVVQNEKRQGENRPYGRVNEQMLANTFPANHPYRHSTIGSMEDLESASLRDVKDWFRDYYGAANTTLVLAGDITVAQARAKALRYFGDIPAGPPVPRQQPWIAARSDSTRGTQYDHVAQTRIYRQWNVPQLGHEQQPLLALAADILGGHKTSRLYRRLVYADRLVDDIWVHIQPLALASQFTLVADVRSGVDPAEVEKAVAGEWQRFLRDGPTADELERVRNLRRADFLRGLEKVGGFGGKAVVLAEGQVYRDDPAAYLVDQQRIAAATPDSIAAAARQWLAQGDYTLTVLPAPPDADLATLNQDSGGLPAAEGRPAAVLPKPERYRTRRSRVDRDSGVPVVEGFPDLSFPGIERGKLRNGIEVVLAQRHTVPLTQVLLQFDAGYAADQGRKPGTASFTAAMLDEGTQSLDSLQIEERTQQLGARISAGAGLDRNTLRLSALNAQLRPSLQLFADIVRNPAFREADIERVRAQWLAQIAQEKTQPMGLAMRVLPPLLYGEAHAYGIPFTGSGDVDSILALQGDDLRAFQRDYLRPDNVRIIVAGATTLEAIIAELERALGDWQAPPTPVPDKAIANVDTQDSPRVYLIHRPGAQQSLILAGALMPPTGAPDHLALQLANAAFGGTFTSRLNMNLREDKRWSYGASTVLLDAIGQRPLLLYAPVQVDQTAPSLTEALRELAGVSGAQPLSSEEVDKVKEQRVRTLPGSFETTGSILGVLAGNELYGRPDNYVTTLKERIEQTPLKAVRGAARSLFAPQHFTWVIVGDLDQIEEPIRALDIGPLQVLDGDGQPLERKP